jgi:M6 family metalloprotease-like protein
MKYNAITNPIGYQDSEATEREHTLLQAAVNSVAGQLSSSINIDNDGDGNVDNVCFIVQGASEGWSDLLWPHRWALYTKDAFINTKKVYDYNFQIQNSLDASVLCHEMFHSLGAPDLYHYTPGDPDLNPVGQWDLMNSDMGQHMTQYMKYRYGNWIDNIPEITVSGDYSLNPVFTKENSCYKIKSPYTTTEYFVVEYRKKEKFDAVLPSEGLLFYRINTLLDGGGNSDGPPDELYVYRPNGSLTSVGTLSAAPFNAGLDKTSFSDKTNPDPFLSNGGIGGLNVSNISAIGATMSFHVEIATPLSIDVAATKILTPVSSPTLTSAEKIKVNISGLGSTAVASGVKVNYSINGGAVVSEDFAGTLAIGTSIPFEFTTTANLSATGTYTIKVYTTLASDQNTANDTATITISNLIPLEYLATHASTMVGTYTDLTTGSTIAVDAAKDGLSVPVTFPDGFTFNFGGVPFTQFILSTNGFIKLGDQNPSSKSLFFSTPKVVDGSVLGGIFNSLSDADNGIIAPFNYDLTPANGGAEYRIGISGVTPSRIVTIQFKNVRDNDAILPNQYASMNFQIKLYETSNIIEFVYGLWTPSTNTSDYRHALAGLRGFGNLPSQLLAINKGSSIPWSQVTFANDNYTTSAALNFGNTTDGSRPAPEVGTTIHLTPRQSNDIAVKEVYTMGQLPLNLATPHTISAAIINYGTSAQTNVDVTLSVTGANSYNPAIITIPSMAPSEIVVVNFADYAPTVIGENTVNVSVPNDDYSSNNSKSIAQSTTANKFCYAETGTAAENAYSGGFIAVCKYHVTGSEKIVSVDAMILNYSLLTSKATKAYVFNAAGVVIGQSTTFTVSSSNLGKWVTLAISAQPLVTDADFYVGLDCSGGNFGAYQTEDPTRTGAYYKIPVGGGTPVEFGYNARFMFNATGSPATGIDPNNTNSINIYSDTRDIYVDIPTLEGTAKLEIYSIRGNQVYQKVNLSQGLNRIEESFTTGIYIVKVVIQNKVITQKVVIQK